MHTGSSRRYLAWMMIWAALIMPVLGQDAAVQKKLWQFKTGGKIFASPVVQDGTVYIGSSDGFLYGVDALSGREKWRFKTGGPVKSDAAVDGDRVFFGSMGGTYYAVDRESGKQVWRFETGGEQVYGPWDYYQSTPVVSGDTVYFGSGDHFIYAVHKQTGNEIWRFKTDGIVHAKGAVSDGRICFGSFDGNLYCLDAATGKLIWKFDTVGNRYFPKGEIQGGAAIVNGVVYFGSRDYTLYALNLKDGTGIWMELTPSWVIATPVVTDGVLYLGNSDDPRCYAFDAETGEQLWEYPVLLNIFGRAAVHGDRVYYPSFDGRVYVLNRETGTFMRTFQSDLADVNFPQLFTDDRKVKPALLEKARETHNYGELYDRFHSLGSVLGAPVIADGVLYFASTDGSLYAWQIGEDRE